MAERRGNKLKLGAFFHPTGHHIAAWLHPDGQIDAGSNFAHYVNITQTAERAKFDLVFLADAVATRDGNLRRAAGRNTWRISNRGRCCPGWPQSRSTSDWRQRQPRATTSLFTSRENLLL